MAREFAFAKRKDATSVGENIQKWKVLIVDDEPDIHDATRLALRNVTFEGMKLDFISASSGGEGYRLLENDPEIAVAFIDVVMESEDAGLLLAKRIRQELKNTLVRIILRTGQPGSAPEENVIVDYDINDYKTKTELTTQKLFTTLVAALRSYQQLRILEASQTGLRRIIEASDTLFKVRSMREFYRGVLEQVSGFLGGNCDGLMCVRRLKGVTQVLAASGRFNDAVETEADDLPVLRENLLDAMALAVLNQALETRQTVTGPTALAFHFGSGEDDMVVLLSQNKRPLSDLEIALLSVFCQKVAAAYENIALYNDLERRVEERTEALQEANQKLHKIATTDFLTGAMNRRAFIEVAENELERMRRYGGDATLLLFDLDKFKSINDTHGHQAGDQVLIRFAAIVQQALRSVDFFGRLGGEEFGAILPETESNSALLVAERIRAAVASAAFELAEGRVEVTVSIGLSPLRAEQGRQLDDAMHRADVALYRAKHNGRNRVEVALPE